MSNKITLFNHEKFGSVRTLLINDEPWAVAKDVAVALGYADTKQAVKLNCKNTQPLPADAMGGIRTPPNIIPESDIFRLIMRSRLPAAEQFQDWVCEEVLPSIRKTGSYSLPSWPKTAEELRGTIEVAKLLGYAGNHAILVGVGAIKKQFNVDILDAMGTPTPTTERQDRLLTPTEVGAPFKLSGHATNRELERLGLQKDVHEVGAPASWVLSEAGREYGCYLHDARSDTTLVRKIFWFPLVRELIQARAVQEYCREAEKENAESDSRLVTQD